MFKAGRDKRAGSMTQDFISKEILKTAYDFPSILQLHYALLWVVPSHRIPVKYLELGRDKNVEKLKRCEDFFKKLFPFCELVLNTNLQRQWEFTSLLIDPAALMDKSVTGDKRAARAREINATETHLQLCNDFKQFCILTQKAGVRQT